MADVTKPIMVAFKAVMSRGDDIPLDPHEIDVLTRGAAAGQFVRVRQGLINPSYLVSIVEDTKRKEKYLDDTRHERADSPKRLKGMAPLKDIFAEAPLQIAGPRT